MQQAVPRGAPRHARGFEKEGRADHQGREPRDRFLAVVVRGLAALLLPKALQRHIAVRLPVLSEQRRDQAPRQLLERAHARGEHAVADLRETARVRLHRVGHDPGSLGALSLVQLFLVLVYSFDELVNGLDGNGVRLLWIAPNEGGNAVGVPERRCTGLARGACPQYRVGERV